MAFTTLQLLHRLSRKCRVDIGNFSGADRLELLDAANAGLDAFAKLLPQTRRESPAGGTLRPPVILEVDILEGATGFVYTGSPWPSGGYAQEEDLVGHSVIIAGDASVNRLHRTGELLTAYLGDSATRNATFYGDAIQMGQDDRRIIGRPIYNDGTTERHLVPLKDPRSRWWQFPLRTIATIEVGTPEFYWTEPLLPTERTDTPLWLLRVWPLPTVLGTLSFRLESLPAALELEDFTTARDLPVEDREVPHLIALAAEGLMDSDLLKDNITAANLDAAANRARGSLTIQEQTRDSRPRRVGTRRGF